LLIRQDADGARPSQTRKEFAALLRSTVVNIANLFLPVHGHGLQPPPAEQYCVVERMMKFEVIVIAAAAMALSAVSGDAQVLNEPSSGQAGGQITGQTSGLAGGISGDVAATAGPVTRQAADGQADTNASLSSIDRAGRDTAPRTRGAVEVKGQNADGLGNITTGVEVAGGLQVSPASAPVSGSGSVETGSY
jgi:hypothetical protein